MTDDMKSATGINLIAEGGQRRRPSYIDVQRIHEFITEKVNYSVSLKNENYIYEL